MTWCNKRDLFVYGSVEDDAIYVFLLVESNHCSNSNTLPIILDKPEVNQNVSPLLSAVEKSSLIAANSTSMAWILIIASLLFLWIVSLCTILLLPRIPFTKHNGRALRKKNVLLVVGHPDDESMFFTPTINFLTSRGHSVQILCLSTGDADGKGNIRKQELFQACAALMVPMHRVKIVNHPDLQDGFGKIWNHSLLAKIIEEEITSHSIDMIITFDNYGVSGHCNHRDVHYGVRRLLYDTSQRDIEVWELVSTNILRKYSGPVDIWLSMFWAMLHSNGTVQCLVNEHSRRSFIAMAQHSSQWVWFRKLFVALSSYTYMNTLRKIN